MNEEIIQLEDYKRVIELKDKLDKGEITNDGIDLSDLDDINDLYIREINDLGKEIDELKKTNIKLKSILNSIK